MQWVSMAIRSAEESVWMETSNAVSETAVSGRSFVYFGEDSKISKCGFLESCAETPLS